MSLPIFSCSPVSHLSTLLKGQQGAPVLTAHDYVKSNPEFFFKDEWRGWDYWFGTGKFINHSIKLPKRKPSEPRTTYTLHLDGENGMDGIIQSSVKVIKVPGCEGLFVQPSIFNAGRHTDGSAFFQRTTRLSPPAHHTLPGRTEYECKFPWTCRAVCLLTPIPFVHRFDSDRQGCCPERCACARNIPDSDSEKSNILSRAKSPTLCALRPFGPRGSLGEYALQTMRWGGLG